MGVSIKGNLRREIWGVRRRFWWVLIIRVWSLASFWGNTKGNRNRRIILTQTPRRGNIISSWTWITSDRRFTAIKTQFRWRTLPKKLVFGHLVHKRAIYMERKRRKSENRNKYRSSTARNQSKSSERRRQFPLTNDIQTRWPNPSPIS